MVQVTQSMQSKAWMRYFNPLAVLKINGSELRQAYSCFRRDPAAGIHHILVAGRGSVWQNGVEARLARQAWALKDAEATIDLVALLQLPPDTLGGAYARHMRQQGFNPQEFIHAHDPQQNWVSRRAAVAHDVHHIITGFDASPIGEYGLAAFSLVQYGDLLNVFVLSFLPLFLLSDLRSAPQLLLSTFKGFWMGLTCRPIFAYPFEANWNRSLAEVRQALRITLEGV